MNVDEVKILGKIKSLRINLVEDCYKNYLRNKNLSKLTKVRILTLKIIRNKEKNIFFANI